MGKTRDDAVGRLARLRLRLAEGGFDGFVVPRADEHQGEYVPPRAERLAWLTGFTGSAGLAVVLADKATIFADGRYTLQVGQEVDTELFAPLHLVDDPPGAWISANLPSGARLGYDPWLHTADGVTRLRAACEKAGGWLAAVSDNPIDALWTDRPLAPQAPVVIHEARFAGQSSQDKRRDLGAALAAERVAATILTLPDSIAWLLNIRGGDVPYAPLALCFAILHASGHVTLFIDRRKLSSAVERHLDGDVQVAPMAALGPALDELGAGRRRVMVDPATAAAWILDRLTTAGAELVKADDPCLLPKACKNPVELEGARAAHRRDGAALTSFLAWLAGAAPGGRLTEIEAADRLESLRARNEHYRGPSFPTIAGAGPHGAIVHYRATPDSDRRLEPGQLFLLDSGAQYLDGTTDVTRTIAIGTPDAEMCDRFTRVLRGHIALASAVFPQGTTGSQLDVLARRPLWEVGLDYDHGTGHGVGSHLGVHEGPQRISKIANAVALRPGMILSNEPGYYRAGAWGIRIENLQAVSALTLAGAERPMLGFEPLTLAPIDRALIDATALSAAETAWVDGYHERVRNTLAPLLEPDIAAWLGEATRPL